MLVWRHAYLSALRRSMGSVCSSEEPIAAGEGVPASDNAREVTADNPLGDCEHLWHCDCWPRTSWF
jgi:hypothetical protein